MKDTRPHIVQAPESWAGQQKEPMSRSITQNQIEHLQSDFPQMRNN